jgi:hypothetical protein
VDGERRYAKSKSWPKPAPRTQNEAMRENYFRRLVDRKAILTSAGTRACGTHEAHERPQRARGTLRSAHPSASCPWGAVAVVATVVEGWWDPVQPCLAVGQTSLWS